MLAAALGALAVGAGYCYGWARFQALLALWVPFMAGNVWLTAMLLLPDHPVWFGCIVGGLAGVPAFILAVIVADMRFGIFPLDTFYGIIAVVFLTPAYFLFNCVLLAVV